jgi:hypothetical protein
MSSMLHCHNGILHFLFRILGIKADKRFTMMDSAKHVKLRAGDQHIAYLGSGYNEYTFTFHDVL